MQTKAEKLEQLDLAILDGMIDCVKSGELQNLTLYTTAVTYLKANQVVEPPKNNDEDPVAVRKKKLEEVKKRREMDEQV